MQEKHLKLLDKLDIIANFMTADHDIDKVVDALSKIINKYGEHIEKIEKQMEQVQKNLNNCLKYTEELEKEVAILKKDSHPPVFTLDDYKVLVKRIDTIEKKCKCKGK